MDGAALAAGAGIGVLTTVCCAWRWTIVARGLGLRLSLPAAVAAYYRSQFLNLTLPGGVARRRPPRRQPRARRCATSGRGLRAVAWERTAGQVVQAVLTVAVLLALPSPVRSSMPAGRGRARRDGDRRPGGRRRARPAWTLAVGAGAAARSPATSATRSWPGRRWPAIVLASALVVVGHAVTFVIAARTAGANAPVSQLLPLALLAMLAMVLPSVAGWGPREGATAWAFAAAGLGAEQGVATAVVYGVMVLVASLPGALVLVAAWTASRTRSHDPDGAADA